MLSWLHRGNEGLLRAAIPIPKSSESQEHCRPWPQPQGHALLPCPRETTNLESTSSIHCQWEQLCSPNPSPQPQGGWNWEEHREGSWVCGHPGSTGCHGCGAAIPDSCSLSPSGTSHRPHPAVLILPAAHSLGPGQHPPLQEQARVRSGRSSLLPAERILREEALGQSLWDGTPQACSLKSSFAFSNGSLGLLCPWGCL